jgi:UDP-glucose 4-epimerase
MKLLLTGANGLIGKHLANNLYLKGNNIIGLGRSELDPTFTSFPYYQMDLAINPSLYDETIQSNIDVVIHCASQQPSHGSSCFDFYNSNILATSNLLSWMESRGIKKLVYFSTLALLKFSKKDNNALDEKATLFPDNAYTISKASVEQILSVYSMKNQMSVYCLRIPSVVHPNQKGGIVDTYYKKAINGEDLEVYDMGEMKRNLINVYSISDIVEKIILEINGSFNLFNIGSSDSWRQLDIARYFYEKFSRLSKISAVTTNSKVSGNWMINTSKAEKYLNFKPWSIQEILDKYCDDLS